MAAASATGALVRARALLFVAILVATAVVPAASAAQPAGQTHVLVVSGVSGEPRFAESFHKWGTALVTAALERYGLPPDQVVYLAEDPARDASRIKGRSGKVEVESALAAMVARAREGDRIVVVLFGHGSSQGGASRFNLPGPDITAEDFARILKPAKAAVVFVNTTSASGEFVKALSGPDRVIITATKSAREQNETYFPEHFVAALTSDNGDADKDGRVSILEAFTYARREVERIFEQGNRIASEHPQLDDDGDGVAHSEASANGPDGKRARTIYLEPLGGAKLSSDPRAAQLMVERREIEARIDSLRGRRSAMTEDAYQKALEPLLVQLAEKTRELRALEARKP